METAAIDTPATTREHGTRGGRVILANDTKVKAKIILFNLQRKQIFLFLFSKCRLRNKFNIVVESKAKQASEHKQATRDLVFVI